LEAGGPEPFVLLPARCESRSNDDFHSRAARQSAKKGAPTLAFTAALRKRSAITHVRLQQPTGHLRRPWEMAVLTSDALWGEDAHALLATDAAERLAPHAWVQLPLLDEGVGDHWTYELTAPSSSSLSAARFVRVILRPCRMEPPAPPSSACPSFAAVELFGFESGKYHQRGATEALTPLVNFNNRTSKDESGESLVAALRCAVTAAEGGEAPTPNDANIPRPPVSPGLLWPPVPSRPEVALNADVDGRLLVAPDTALTAPVPSATPALGQAELLLSPLDNAPLCDAWSAPSDVHKVAFRLMVPPHVTLKGAFIVAGGHGLSAVSVGISAARGLGADGHIAEREILTLGPYEHRAVYLPAALSKSQVVSHLLVELGFKQVCIGEIGRFWPQCWGLRMWTGACAGSSFSLDLTLHQRLF
jgi:hypothetical protein